MKRALLLVAVLAVVTMAAAAQDWTMDPNFGSVELENGFDPDPYVIELVAGGPNDASELCYDCIGMVADAPDIDLYYDAGDYSLYIAATSDADVTLLVRAPDGEYYGNDDYMDYDPMVVFEEPMAGLYSIWVGTFGEDPIAALLGISEIGPD